MDKLESFNFMASEKIVPSVEETNDIFKKRIANPSYGNIDFKILKTANFSESFGLKLIKVIDSLPDLKAESSEIISNITQTAIKGCDIFVPNKSHNLDPSKWFLFVYEKAKYFVFGKTVAIDFNDEYFFDQLGLKDKKERAKKLELVTNFHNAMKTGNNTSIEYNTNALKSGWYEVLLNKGVKCFISEAHKIYWTLVLYDMIPVHNSYYGTVNPPQDWFMYPLYANMRKMFSKEVPDSILNFGPPIALLKNPLFPGKMICDVGVFFKYSASLFGGKLSIERNGKTYI
jgi:hypothetical protein